MEAATTAQAIEYILIRDSQGWYIGFVPIFGNCFAVGETIEELEDNLVDAVRLHAETLEANYPRAEFLGTRRIEL